MHNLSLYIPSIEDYWYEEKVQSDPNTMGYNAGYDVSYYGYHYETGCIDFSKSRWEETYNKRINENRYECGILIDSKYRGRGYLKESLKLLCDTARSNGIKELYDNFEIDRGNTLKVFESVGFIVVKETTWKKFGKQVNGVEVKIEL